MATEKVQILIDAKNNASRELNKVSSDLQRLGQSASRLMSQGGIAAAVGAGVAAAIAKTGSELARLASNFDALYASFENLASSAGTSAETMLTAMRKASQGMISDMDLVQSANRALLLGVADTADEMDQLLQVAIVRGQAMGLSASQAFNDLVTGIGRMSPLILDNLGIVTGGQKVFDDYAEAIGKSADALTDAEKKQALLNKVVSESGEMIATSTDSATRGYERLSAAIDNAKNALGQMFNDDVNARAGDLADIIIRLIDRLEKYDSTVQKELALFPVEQEMDAVAERIAELESLQTQLRRDLAQGANAADYESSRKALTGVNAELELLTRRQRELIDDAAGLSAQHDTWVQSFGAMSDISNPAIQSMTDLGEAVDGVGEAIKEVAEIDLDQITSDFAELMGILQTQREQFGGQATASEYEYFGAAAGAAQSYEQQLANLQQQNKNTANTSAEAADGVTKVGDASAMMAGMVSTAAGAIPGLIRQLSDLRAESLTTAGAIAVAFESMQKVYEGPLGLSSGQKGKIQMPLLEAGDGMKSIALESGAAAAGVGRVNSEFESLKSTISGIVSGAIGPVAGVDANDLLPRPDAVNENARRLADIAVNGFKGQEWLDEFANEVPDIYQALVDSGDPKTAAAQMLKDFQDGLINGTGVLIDKERAKDLVRRALLGQSNTQSLINEIAQELAAETGTAFSTVQAQAQSILGGGLSSDNGTGAAFSRGMVDGVSNSTLGADLSGAIFAQVTASVALIEDSGREAGRALVRGVTATFSDIPAAFIAAVVSLAMPGIMANMSSNGGRTGAADV